MTRVVLVTTGQPSTNPRLVKEADALVEAGFDVEVIGAHWAPWAVEADGRLLASRGWRCTLIDWRRGSAPALFWKSRLRQRAALAGLAVPAVADWATNAALSRVTPELVQMAVRIRADLYIAHNLGALPAALAAAEQHQARVGFDAEDFHSGEFHPDDQSPRRLAIQRAERSLLPRCDYVTAAAPGIAEAYAPYCLRAGRPVCVLNVFPLASRPPQRRPTDDAGPLALYWFSQTIGAERGLEDIVRAMARLADGSVELHLRGRWQVGFREQLLAVAEQAGLNQERIHSYDPADSDHMVALAARYDVGLAVEPGTSPNSRILLSNKVFTYLLAGTAIIATATAGQAALGGRLGSSCAFYPPADVDAAADHLARWVGDRSLLEASRAAAWALGESEFNWDTEKHVFLDVVDRVLSVRVPA